MVIDTSALVAILQGEPDSAALVKAIEQAHYRRISAAAWLETSIVIDRRYGTEGLRYLDRFVASAGIRTEAALP